MIKQYCRVALRNLARQKVLAFINVMGLSIGLACFIVFLLYALYQFSYDRFQTRAPDIYRVIEWTNGSSDREPGGSAGLSMGMGPALAQDFPDVAQYVRFRSRANRLVKVGDEITRLTVSYADPSFFSVFSFPLSAGDPAHALSGTHSVVLTREMAHQLFGQEDVVGRSVQIKSDSTYESFLITAVADNLPSNSVFSFGLLIGYPYVMAHASKEALTDWYETEGDNTYVLLRPGSDLATDWHRMVAFRERHLPNEEADWIKNKRWNGKGIPPFFFTLQPLRDIHTNPSVDGSGDPVDPKNIWLLIGMAAGVLLIACINFTTLSIGRSAGRAKEVGVRKVIGSSRGQLAGQFLAEALVLTVTASLIALLLVYLLLPFMDQLTGTSLHLDFHQFPALGWLLGALVLITGLLAGSYPALILSGFKPLDVLKSKVKVSGSNFFTRSLVIAQFVLSAGLVMATAVVLQQLSFMRSMDLGFQKENVIDIRTSGVENPQMYPLFRQAELLDSRIRGLAAADIGMGGGNGFMGSGYSYRGQGGGAIEYPVDPDYLPVMGIKLLYGRNFSRGLLADSTTSIIVNQALLEEYHIGADSAIGQLLDKPNDAGKDVYYTIIGVVNNFNFASVSEKVRPQLFFWPSGMAANHIYVRVAPGDPAGVLTSLRHTWNSLVPGLPFDYGFLDEEMNRFYDSETKWGQTIGWAGTLSICLACLGLFGLAALVVVNRNKEMGIRKVLGASVGAIVELISLEFSRLIILSLLIAIPAAWYFTHRWLEGYANHVTISWWIFALTSAATLGLSLLTVSFHAVKAALSNPVNALRSE